jgi:hypothetical protein
MVFPSAPLNPNSSTRILQLIFAFTRSSDSAGGQRAIAELDNYVMANSEDLGKISPAQIARLHTERVNRFFANHPVAALTEFASNPGARTLPDGNAVTCTSGASNYPALSLTEDEMRQLGAGDRPAATPILTRILAASDPLRTPILTLEPTQSVWGGFHDQTAALSDATDPFYQVHYRLEGRACVALALCEPVSALMLDWSGPTESPTFNELLSIRQADLSNPPPPSAATCTVNEGPRDPVVGMMFLVICGGCCHRAARAACRRWR